MDDQHLDLSRKSSSSVVEPYFSTKIDLEPGKRHEINTSNRLESYKELSKETGKSGGIVRTQHTAASFDERTRKKGTPYQYKLPTVSKTVSSNKTMFTNLDGNSLVGETTPESAQYSFYLKTRVLETASPEDAAESCIMVERQISKTRVVETKPSKEAAESCVMFKRQLNKEPATNSDLKTNICFVSSSFVKNKDLSGATTNVSEGCRLYYPNDGGKLKTVKPAFVCGYCEKNFKYRSKLDAHVRSHTGEKPFGCEQCEKKFAQKGNLNSHVVRAHTTYRSFQCNECDKAFCQKSDLKKHSLIHSGERPFQCSICTMTFTQSSNLYVHERTIHSVKKTLQM